MLNRCMLSQIEEMLTWKRIIAKMEWDEVNSCTKMEWSPKVRLIHNDKENIIKIYIK